MRFIAKQAKALLRPVKRVFDTFYRCLRQKLTPALPISVIADNYLERCHKQGSARKVLYISHKYDYGQVKLGLAYEEYNFFHTLRNMDAVDLLRLDSESIANKYGKDNLNKVVKEVAILERPDIIFLMVGGDFWDYSILKSLRDDYKIEIIGWLFDDDKRYQETEQLAQCFSKIVTTMHDRHILRLKRNLNSVLCQFSVNQYIYFNYQLPKKYNVVFIGVNFNDRQDYVDHLRKSGINVAAFGRGWNTGRLSQADMIEILNQAKIVLNFSGSQDHGHLRFLKGRVFEVTGMGCFLLTEQCVGLSDYFEIGKDLDVFSDKNELLQKVKYYLNQPDLCQEIGLRAQQKVLANLTYEKQFKHLFGLQHA